MHPEIESDKPGKCPKCGRMDLIPKEKSKAVAMKPVSLLSEYKPLIIITGLILLVTIILAVHSASIGAFSWEQVMANFMAGFFLVFAGFKLLDLEGFAHGYSTYDLLAKQFFGYGYVYPFIELGLGLLYLIGYQTVPVLAFTVIIMGFSGLGVLRSVMKKEEVHCACLGTLIKVPLTTVALVEDFSMALMALVMLVVKLQLI